MLKLPWFVCLLVAAVLGGLWGAIPGFFKAYFNINEVITSIMFNWIGLYLVNELVYQNGTGPMYDVRNTRTLNLGKNADFAQSIIPDFGLNSCSRPTAPPSPSSWRRSWRSWSGWC